MYTASNAVSLVELRDVDRDFVIKGDSSKSASNLHTLHALSKVSLKLQQGEFVFLTGASGSGKTTLIRLILGLDGPTNGQVFTLGKPVHQLNENQRRELRRHIGIIFQDHRLLSSLNVYENIELPLYLMNMGPKERRKRVLEILEIVQLQDFWENPVSTLSAGEKQRLAIARALVIRPKLIVADEPTGNLDPSSARSLVRMLRELKGHGTTVLIATHDMSLVRDFGGRVLELLAGSLPARSQSPASVAYRVPSFWKEEPAIR